MDIEGLIAALLGELKVHNATSQTKMSLTTFLIAQNLEAAPRTP